MHQASVGFHCPNCVKQGKQKVMTGRAAFGGAFQPVVTLALMAVNIAVFLIGAARPKNQMLFDYGVFGGTTEYYRLVTSGFLHSGLLHVALNMWALYNLGPTVERSLGRLRFGLVYAVALLAGAAGAVIFTPNDLTVGASGALYGLFAALVVIYRRHGVDIMRSGLGLTILLNVVFTLAIPNISIAGHAGGFAGGLVATWLAVNGGRVLGSARNAVVALGALVPLLFVIGAVAMNRA